MFKKTIIVVIYYCHKRLDHYEGNIYSDGDQNCITCLKSKTFFVVAVNNLKNCDYYCT
jgi:hypothetical protein